MNDLNGVLIEGICELALEDWVTIVCTYTDRCNDTLTKEITKMRIVPATPKVRMPKYGEWVRVVGRIRYEERFCMLVVAAEYIQVLPKDGEKE